MSEYQLTYFDMKGGRGQVARLAFELAGIDFDDNRLSFAEFVAAKSSYPFGALPILEHQGQTLAQSNAINRYVGKLTGLYPSDPWQAALCDQAMDAVEDIDNKMMPSMFLKDEDEKRAARKALAEGPIACTLKNLAACLQAQGGQFFADGRLTVADLKVFVWVRALRSGRIDHMASDLPDTLAASLVAHSEHVLKLPVIAKHYD